MPDMTRIRRAWFIFEKYRNYSGYSILCLLKIRYKIIIDSGLIGKLSKKNLLIESFLFPCEAFPTLLIESKHIN